MHFEVDRENTTLNNDPEPSLADMAEKAIRILKRNDKGFFLLIEGMFMGRPPKSTIIFVVISMNRLSRFPNIKTNPSQTQKR